MAINYDDYKKKYKKQIEENRDKWRKQNEVSVSNTKKTTQTTTTTTQKNDDKKWYQKIFQKPESFEDGYDFGDVTKTILGTTADVGLNLVEGVARVGEGIGKLGAGGIAQVADWIGQDDYAEKVRNRIAGKEKTAFGTTGAPVSSWLNSAQNKLDSHSITGESGDEIASLVGYTGGLMVGGNALGGLTKTGTVGSVATSSAGVTTGTGLSANLGNIGVTVAGKTLNVPTLAFVGGASSGLTEAYGKENVTDTQAWSKALGSGAIEGITEGLFGMFGVGGSSLDDALTKVVTNKLKTGLTKILAKTGVQATGESVEEFLSYAGNQGLDWLIDKASSEESPDFYNKWDWEEVGEQMGMAFISGGITQGGGTIVQTELQTRIAIETAEQELGRKLTESEKTSIKKQVTDAIINETELNQEELIQVQETNDPIAPVQEEVQQEATEDIAPVVEEQQETVTNEVVPPTVQQEITNITNQIDELETMLDTNLTATQQQEILAQIKELEQRYNEITQQEQAVFKTANTQEIGPVEAVNTEQISKPTTQEVETNSLVEAESNTPNVVKSASNDQNIQNEQEIAPLEQKTGTFEQQVMTEEEYLASKGYGAMGYSEPGLHKSSARVSQKVRDKQAKQVQEKAQEYDAKREELRQEYQAKVESGEIRKPTREETLLRTAQGNEDNKSVQSARRLLEKRGIDWKTGEKIGETTKNAQQQEKKATKTTENAQKNENIVQNADRKTPTQEELDNLEYIRKNKSGSEYASAYYDLEKKYGTGLYKGLNSYKDTGKAVQEEIAPVKETIEDLTDTIKDTTKEMKALAKEIKEIKSSVSEVQEEFKALTELDLPMIEQQASENLQSITDDLAPVIEDTTPEYQYENDNEGSMSVVESPFENKDYGEVGKRNVKAYQYENPEVRPYFQAEAQTMLGELDASVKGERIIIGDISQTGNGNYEYSGTTRHTTESIAQLLDGIDGKYKLTYDDIRKGLNAIIEDHGAENIASSKRIEFILDDRLRNGYVTIDGYEIQPNQGYIEILRAKEFDDNYNSIPSNDIAPVETFTEDEIIQKNKGLQETFNSEVANENHPPLTDEFIEELNKQSIEWARRSGKLTETQDIAPVGNQSLAIEQAPNNYDNGGPMIRVSPEMQKRTLNNSTENKEVDWEALEDTSKGEQQHLKVKKLGETIEQKDIDWDSLDDTSKAKQKQYNTETRQLEDAIEKKTKKEIKEKLLKDTGIMNASLDDANNIPKLLMENTDPIRLQEMIFGRGLGTQINNMFFQKVKDNTSEKIRFQNKERAEIKELGIKARSKESAAVQKYGEKQWVNDKGEVLHYGDKELASEFPDTETQEKIKNASKVIRKKYDNYLDTTNKVLTDLGYDAIPKRTDYMRHFQELNDIFSRVGIPYNYNEMTANDLPTDINGLTADFSPSKNFFANALERKGNKTTYDAITGIDGYLEGIGNLIYHTEDIQRLRAYEQYIRDTYGENHGFDNLEQLTDEEKVERVEKIQDNHLSNYASWLHEYTNTLAGKKALIDRSIEGLTGRKIYSFLNTTKTQVGRNMIGFNISSAMTNAIAGVQTLAKTNKLATVKGLADTIKNTFVNDGFVEKNNFLTSRFGSDRLSKNLWQKIGDAGFVFMQGSDYFVSNFVVRSKYNELKAKGLSDEQAHIEAGKYASRLMSDRSQGATPNIYNSQMLGLVTQFQNEVNNQLYSMFYDTYHESKESANGNALKTAMGMTFTLGQMAVFTHLFGKAFESIAGYNPTFDIIGMLMKAFGFDDDEESEDTALDNVSQAFGQLVDALPYVNIITGGGRIPVSEAFTGVTDTFKALTGGKDEYGQDVEWSDAWKSIKESAPYFLLPSGYSQIKKTTKGLGMYDEDLPIAGSYTDSGNLRFTADDSTWGKVQAGIFGQWANEEAQEYVDSDFKTINKSNINEMLDLGMVSSEYRKLKSNINKAGKTTEAKVDYIATLNELTNSQKNTLVNNILDRDYEVDVSNYEDYGSYDEFNFYVKNPEKYDWLQSKGISYEEYSATDESKELYNYAYRYPETYEVGKAITGDFATYKSYADYIWDLKADKDENGDSISGTKKAKVISYVNGLDLSIPQKAMLIRKTYSSFDDYNNDIVEYVSGLDADYDTKKVILEELDFTIDDEGYVYWD